VSRRPYHCSTAINTQQWTRTNKLGAFPDVDARSLALNLSPTTPRGQTGTAAIPAGAPRAAALKRARLLTGAMGVACMEHKGARHYLIESLLFTFL